METNASSVPMDLTALREMLGGSDDLVGIILGKFRPEIEADISQLQVLVDTDDIDAEAVRSLAHRLKGSCSSTKTMPMAEIAQALQFSMAGGDLVTAKPLVEALVTERARIEEYLSQQGY